MVPMATLEDRATHQSHSRPPWKTEPRPHCLPWPSGQDPQLDPSQRTQAYRPRSVFVGWVAILNGWRQLCGLAGNMWSQPLPSWGL